MTINFTKSYELLNLPSLFLLNILIPDLDNLLKNNFKTSFSYTALTDFEYNYFNYTNIFNYNISLNKEIFYIGFFSESSENSILADYIENKKNIFNTILGLITGFKAELSISREKINYKEGVRIDLYFLKNKTNTAIIIPYGFMDKFYLNKNRSIIKYEEAIYGILLNPYRFFPDIKTVLGIIDPIDLQNIFYILEKEKNLTPYQIALLVLSFPEYTSKIKKSISKNIISESDYLINNLKINKRDLLEGIYSFEEALFFLFRENDAFSFSSFLKQIQKILKIYSIHMAVSGRSFNDWLEQIDSEGLIYKTFSTTNEKIIAEAISYNPGLYRKILKKYLPEERISGIIELSEKYKFTIHDVIESQAFIIANYKRLKIGSLNFNYLNYPAILTKIDQDSMIHVLLNSGWFVLSASLKNINKKKVLQLIEKFPIGAKYLIIDVIEGIINPNIIHDEMQINKARSLCVKKILYLVENGIINLQ